MYRNAQSFEKKKSMLYDATVFCKQVNLKLHLFEASETYNQ